MAKKKYSTPGVYIEEKDAFSRSVVPVPTAVPCFIGYTQKAIRNNVRIGKQLIKIQSLGDYINIFGGAAPTKYTVKVEENNHWQVSIKSEDKSFYFFNSMKLYFANGGGDCYIYSVGGYDTIQFKLDDFTAALDALLKEPEPTLIISPDAHNLEKEDYYTFWQKVLPHCEKMINRFAIFDVYGGGKVEKLNDEERQGLIDDFRNGIGNNLLAYGAVYWPWIQATVVQSTDLDFRNIANFSAVKTSLTNYTSNVLYPDGRDGSVNPKATMINEFIDKIPNEPTSLLGPNSDQAALLQLSPLYKTIMQRMQDIANILPASGAMAGVYKFVDNQVGTFKAPANISLKAVSKPLITIDNHDQESLNIPVDGKALNAIRTFPGKGTLVWGARTLDGNSQDWRYISVRRTVSMIELSVKYAAEAYVFEPNVSSTWTNINVMISNFLNNMWHQGALAGSTAAEAYSVSVGLGSTMTGEDILDGYMRIEVKVAITRPAEFIVITFQQQMQTS